MAFPNTGTMLANLVDPEVMAALIDKKLINNLAFAPITRIDNTLVGVPGSTITVPYFNYIGAATVVAEGADIPISQLTATSTPAQVVKFGKGVQLTDESVLSGYGRPLDQAAYQIALAIADAIDNAELAILQGITGTMAVTPAAFTTDAVADALVKFGEDINEEKYLYVSPTNYAVLRKSNGWLPGTDIAADMYVRGVVGMVQGCRVIVSNRVGDKEAYIAKPDAVGLYLKRDTIVETARDIINKSTVITGDKHAAIAMYDASKAIKMSWT